MTTYAEAILADSPSLYWRFGESTQPITQASYTALILSDGGINLLGYWTLGASGGLTDRSTGGHNGTAQGGVTIGGVAGPAADLTATDFDGTDDWIKTTFAPYVNGTIRTFEGWAYRDTNATIDVLVGGEVSGTGPFLRLVAGSNDVVFDMDSSGGASAATWTGAWPGTAQWVHWMLVANETGDAAKLYINGALVSSQSPLDPYNASPGNFKIGAMGLTTGNPFDGKICHVAVYTDDMSPYAAGHYAAMTSGIAPTTAVDSSGNSHDGTYHGVTLGQDGLIADDPDTAVGFNGGEYVSCASYTAGSSGSPADAVRTYEAWFQTSNATAGSGASGDVIFGQNPGAQKMYIALQSDAGATGISRVAFTPNRSASNPLSSGAGFVWNPHFNLGLRPVHLVLVHTLATGTAELFLNGFSYGVSLDSTPYVGGTILIGTDQGTEALFQGTIDEVAIYEHALDPARIRTHYLIGLRPDAPFQAPRIREPIEHGLTLQLTDGTSRRFGPDESNVQRVPMAISFDTQIPGGFGPSNITIPRPDDFDPLEAKLFASTRIYEARSNRTFHEGRITGTPQVGATSIELELEGWAKHLEDDNTARWIPYDRDLSHWQGMSVQRKVNLLSGGNGATDGNVQPDVSTGVPAIDTGLDGSWGNNVTGEAWYNAQDLPIGGLDWAWKITSAFYTDITWQWYALLSSDDVVTSSNITSNQRSAGPASGTLTASGVAKKFACLEQVSPTTGGTDGVHYAVLWTLAAVFGTHGLTLQGSVSAPNTGRGLFVSDMAAYAIGRWAPLLNFSTGFQGSIEPTTFVVPHMTFLDDTNALAMIEAMVLLGGSSSLPLDWGVYENREFFMRSPGNYGKIWRARRDQATEPTDQGPEASTRLNGIKVSYDDGSGTKRTVGPVGSNSTTETSDLQDTDPTNPANLDGARHWHIYDAGITSLAGAKLIGQLILADANQQKKWRGTVVMKGEVKDDAGNVYPAGRVRAGDSVIIEDDADTAPRRIVGTSYSADTRSVSCDVGVQPDRLATLLARSDVVLTGIVK